MHPPAHALRRRFAPVIIACAALIGLTASSGCAGRNPGEDPPDDELFFPSGMLLDPRQDPDLPARYLFVANGNNDLAYNAGTLVAVDLEAFFDSWSRKDALGNHTFEVEPYCTDDACVLDIGSPIDADRPCRRLALLPQVVECDESPFIDERGTQRIGDFATLLATSCEQYAGGVSPERPDSSDATPRPAARCEEPRLWLPQRGDPSILYVDAGGDPNELPTLECDAPFVDEDGDGDNDADCGSRNRLMFQRNDDELTALPREPFNMVVSQQSRMAYVTHSDGVGLTLVDLDGIDDGSGVAGNRPAIVDIATVFLDPSGTTGGFGLAERPCNPQLSPPAITLGCARPLVYAGLRYSRLLVSFTVQGVTFDDQADAQDKCAGPDELGQPGKIDCDEKVRSQRLIVPGGLDPSSTGFRPILGDVAFADASGDELLVLQTGPGALLKLDTHVGTDGEPLDTPSAPPLELCDEPTRMHLFEDEGQRLALITCYRAALIYIVDLQSFRVLDSIVLGTGPYELEIDEPRKLLYVANNLEGSVTVIDLSRERPTRFREIARIGLQEPFTR